MICRSDSTRVPHLGQDPAEAWAVPHAQRASPRYHPEAAGDRTHVGLICVINNLFSPKS